MVVVEDAQRLYDVGDHDPAAADAKQVFLFCVSAAEEKL
jgi:hypothetical protein